MSEVRNVSSVVSEGHHSLLAQRETVLMAALRAVEDRLWSTDEVKRRCKMIRLSSWEFGHEVLVIDGKEMVEFLPMQSSTELRGNSYLLTYTLPFRRLYVAGK